MNDPARLAALENQLQLGQSFAYISEHERGEAMRKKEGTKHELLNLAPLAKDNLAKKNGDVSKITKKQICSLLLACYGIELDEQKHPKPSLVEKLSKEIAERPKAVAALIPSAATAANSE
jgi:hypothetical protein